MKSTRSSFVILLAAPLLAPSLWSLGPLPDAIEPPRAPQAEESEQEEAALARLDFMTGCWEGSFQAERGSGIVEERYTSPTENLMLGTTRYLLEGRTVMWEFSKLEASDGAIVLTPFPRGVPSEHAFAMTELGDGEVVFEAPEHDFPKRILYRRDGERLIARIDDGTDEMVSEWEMEPVRCD